MAQSRTMSAVETVMQNVVGFIIAMAVQAIVLPFWGFHPTLAENFWITFIFMAISVIRSYVFRRLFAWLERREERKNTKTWELIVENLPPLEWDNSQRNTLENNEVLVRLGQR
jgi:membrane protein implicated in regulation of membrane protease activity